jgi:ABC-type multidrug transport system fused ATPase/permease subunit
MGSPKVYVAGIVLLVIEAATAVIEAYPIAVLIDYLQGSWPTVRDQGLPAFLGSERLETILVLTVAIVVIAAVNSAADSFTEVCMARGGRSLGYSIRVAMYSHLQRLPLGYHDKKRTGDVLTRVTGDVLVVEDFVVKSVSNILGSLMVLVGSFVFLLSQSWSVALVAVVVVPMLALVSNVFSKRIKVASKTQRDREGDLASTAQEMLTSIRLVQSYGRGTVDLATFSDQTGRSMHASLKAANIQAQFSFVIALVEALSIAAVIWLGVWLVDRQNITVGTLVLFILLLQNMFKPARKIVSEWYKIGKVFASVERIDDLLDREVVVQDLPGALPAPPLTGRLAFRDVCFTYPAEHEDGTPHAQRAAALAGIDFEVAPGEVVALVGHSGAGKSTIAQLVPRLYDPDSGAVLVDGLDLRSLTLASLRRQVSLVLQDTVLLSGTVAENIAYGIDDATRDQVVRAARMANAHTFISDLPDGYDTVLGERGSTLSGGQRQRLAIARAFIRHAPLLILDEPTTGLDAESAQTVVGALRELMRGTTTVVISHDPALVRSADRILVIDGGRIVESGTHDELNDLDGAYVALYRAAAAADEPSAVDGAGTVDGAGAAALASGPAVLGRVDGRGTTAATGGSGFALAERLVPHLPGLALAMDDGAMREHVLPMLAPGLDPAPDSVRGGTWWLRADGTCSVRYHLWAGGARTPHTALARLLPDDETAQQLLDGPVARVANGSARHTPAWAQPSALVAGHGLALHAFPLDPDLPTLARAMNPSTVALLACAPRSASPPEVHVVHHPRDGACVLRYTFAGDEGATPTSLYAKVYPDSGGDVVEVFLEALAEGRHARGDGPVPSFPRPVLYAPSLRLLVTDELPGQPVIPALLRTVLADPATDRDDADRVALRAAVHAAGTSLAALHGSDLATAPVRSAARERAVLRRERELVSRYWPEVAEAVDEAVDGRLAAAAPPPDLVLSHGDFTPAQVLVEGDGTAVVDLDTLCWADPALDLGRFLAHLELLAAKRGGPSATPVVYELTRSFLDGYGGATARTAAAAEAADRIALYRAATLARTALRACRQLKDYRLGLALSLLDATTSRKG